MRLRSAFTLVELILVLAILGITVAVVAVAPPRLASADAASTNDRVAGTRREAVEAAQPVLDTIRVQRTTVLVRALADGRVVVDSVLRAPDGRAR